MVEEVVDSHGPGEDVVNNIGDEILDIDLGLMLIRTMVPLAATQLAAHAITHMAILPQGRLVEDSCYLQMSGETTLGIETKRFQLMRVQTFEATIFHERFARLLRLLCRMRPLTVAS